jgi:hypothetical protein
MATRYSPTYNIHYLASISSKKNHQEALYGLGPPVEISVPR